MTLANSKIFSGLFGQAQVSEVFSDEAYLRTLVAVEVALATVQAELGIVPAAAAKQIAERTPSFHIDYDGLAQKTQRDGFPITGLLAQLREHIGGDAASFLHRGATTQDIMDTALILQLRTALDLLEGNLKGTIRGLSILVERHRDTLMVGRTHSQWALPITFGLKVATWLAPLLRHCERLDELRPRLLVVQFGGAAGTLAALGDRGLEVQGALAQHLGLGLPLTPWHTQRDTLAELAGWLSLVTGSLAKMAQDIILLTQSEVGEVRESADPARGGSSTMPQKSNPIKSELIIAAARLNAQMLSTMHHAMIQEHERGTHGWQLEWLALPQMVNLTASALVHAHQLSHELTVNEARMQFNVEASRGLMLAEAASFILAEQMPLPEAKDVVKRAAMLASETGEALVETLQIMLEDSVCVKVEWNSLTESQYLGETHRLIDRLLSEVVRLIG